MLELRLRAFIKENGDVTLRFSWPTRTVFLAIGLAIFVSMAISGEYSVFGFALVVIAVFGGIFEESWHYKADEHRFVHRSGLLFLAKTRSIPVADVEHLELRSFKRGKQGAPIPATVGGEPYPAHPEDENKKPAVSISGEDSRPRFGIPGFGGKNPFSRTWVLLAIHHKEHGRIIVETHTMRHDDDLVHAAKAIAKHSKLRLEELIEG